MTTVEQSSDPSWAIYRRAIYRREEVVRRAVRRVAVALKLDDCGSRVDLSGISPQERWEREAFKSGCRQLGMFVTEIDSASLRDVADLVHAGHVVAIPRHNAEYTILEQELGKKFACTTVNSNVQHETLSKRTIERLIEEADTNVLVAKRELQCDTLSAHVNGEYGHDDHATPQQRFFRLLKLEASDICTVVLFALVAGILSLATPLAVESLVSVVSWGTYLQPLVVLAFILLAALGLSGVLKVLQTIVVEIIQRRQFVRIVGDLAHRFPRAKRAYLTGHYPRELANRVFDIMTIQKATAVLLLDGVSIVLTTCLGMVLLSLYHPFLLGYNIILLLTMISITWLLGRGGISSSIEESVAKYEIAHWLQDVISFPYAFKVNGGESLAIDRADGLAAEYLLARQRHFRVVVRQIVFAIAIQACASTILLGLGGWLVIRGQLTLGQLVASELVVTVVVGAFAKAGKSLEKFYDLMAGIDKVGHLLDIPVDPRRGRVSVPEGPVECEWDTLQLTKGANRRQLAAGRADPGETVAIVADDEAAHSMFVEAFSGLSTSDAGVIEIAGMNAKEAATAGMGRLVAVAQDIEVFCATLAENIELGRSGIGQDGVRAALRAVGLAEAVNELPDSIDTHLATDGFPLSREQQVRLMLARAIVAKPKLLLIGRLLDALSPVERNRLWCSVKEFVAPCTILLATCDRELAEKCDRTMELIEQ